MSIWRKRLHRMWKLGEIGTKRRGYLKLTQKGKKIIEKLKEMGLLRKSDLIKLTGIPKGSIDRVLYVQKEWEIIEQLPNRKFCLKGYGELGHLVRKELKEMGNLGLDDDKNIIELAKRLGRLLKKSNHTIINLLKNLNLC